MKSKRHTKVTQMSFLPWIGWKVEVVKTVKPCCHSTWWRNMNLKRCVNILVGLGSHATIIDSMIHRITTISRCEKYECRVNFGKLDIWGTWYFVKKLGKILNLEKNVELLNFVYIFVEKLGQRTTFSYRSKSLTGQLFSLLHYSFVKHDRRCGHYRLLN